MHPFYFGDSDKQLYGVYDPPRSQTHNDAGVLLCYPVGQEYMRSHWAYRQLISQLCRAGMHCMRFDYYGTGDSAGMLYDAGLDQWQSNISTGLTELKDISGISKVSLVGLRFGAALAASAPVKSHRVRKLVLWDPVVTGTTYIENLRRMHKERLKPLHDIRTKCELQGVEELIGFRFSDNMITQIEAVNLLETSEFSASEIFLIVSEQQEEYEQLSDHLQALGLLKGYQVISGAGGWNNIHGFDSALIASEAINAISGELTTR